VSGPAAIPPEAVQSAAEALRNEGTQGQLEALAAIVLEAAEAVWPHAPPQRESALCDSRGGRIGECSLS